MGLGLPVFWTCRRDDLDKLHFGIRSEVQCPPWVKSCGLAVGPSLPVYPYQQTFSDADGMSEGCHNRSLAERAILPYFSQRC